MAIIGSPSISTHLPVGWAATMASPIRRPTATLSKLMNRRVGDVDRHVVGDGRDALGAGLLERRQDRRAVLRQDDQRIDAARDQTLDVGELLLRIGLRVGADVGVAGILEHRLDAGLVDLPALLLKMPPADPDGLGLGHRGHRHHDHAGHGEHTQRPTAHMTHHCLPHC